MRAHRRALAPASRRASAQAVARRVQRCPWFRAARRVALYQPCGGELDTALLIAIARRANKKIFLPVLAPGRRAALYFSYHIPGAALRRNRLGLHQPRTAVRLPPQRMDLVIAPLIAFDAAGQRLGQGGGFYDRSFAFRMRPQRYARPRLLGIAYAWQEVSLLPRRPWDVPLDAVATERELRRFVRTI